MLKESFNFDFILFFQPQLENKMAAVHILYLITHSFLIRPPNLIKFISKCLVLKALEFEVYINLGYQNTLTSPFQKSVSGIFNLVSIYVKVLLSLLHFELHSYMITIKVDLRHRRRDTTNTP